MLYVLYFYSSLFPTSGSSVPFYSALFLSSTVFYFTRSFAFLLFSFLLYFRDYLTLLYFSFSAVCFIPLCCLFSFAFSMLPFILSLPFSLFPLVLCFINPNAFHPFLGFVRVLFRPILLYLVPVFRLFSLLFLLAFAHHWTSLNFLCVLLQLCFTRSRATLIDLISHYLYATTDHSVTHTRSFASFRSALLRFTLPRISPPPFLSMSSSFHQCISPWSSLFYSALLLSVFSPRDVVRSSVFPLALLCSVAFRVILFLSLPLSLLRLVPPLCSVSREPEALEKSELD